MNIVQIPRRFVREDWGGTETVILETSRCLLRKGHQTQIVCPNALASRNVDEIEGVQVTRTPYFYPYFGLSDDDKRKMNKKGGNLFSLSLMRMLKKLPDVNVLHAHTQKRLGGIVRHVARRRKIPYVVTLHGGIHDVPAAEAATWTAPTKGALEWGKVLGLWVGSRRVLDDAAAIICVGKRETELTRREYPDKRVIYLPNGVDLDRFENGNGAKFREQFEIPKTAKLVTVVGRIDVQKNQILAVKALPKLLQLHPDLHLMLVGHVTNHEYLSELRQAIEEVDCEQRVTIIPGLDPSTGGLVDAYHASDLFLLPSVHEPFGIVILEAWACRLPVVASAVGGIRSLVSHDSDGVLFESNNVEGLTETIHSLLSNPARCRELAEAGFKKAREQYSWRRITDRLIHIYEEVMH